MDISTGFTLKSEDFQLADFSKTASFKSFAHLGFLAFMVPALIAHARALVSAL